MQFLLRWKKKVCRLASSVPLLRGARGALPSILVYKKIRFSERHVRSRKPTMMQKEIITFKQ